MQGSGLGLAAGVILFCGVASAQDMPHTPTGEGDPDTMVCRAPQQVPGSRLSGPQVCKTNAVWARYRKDGMDVAPDGVHDVPSEKYRSAHPMACRPATAGGSSASNAMQTNLGMVCE